MILNIQALRGLAVLSTVFYHLPVLLAALRVPQFGYGGVDIFFVISGFIMVYTTADRPVTPWTFMAGRIRRIVPLYWLMTVAVLAVAVAAPSLLQATRVNGMDLLKSLAFVPFAKSNGEVQPMLFVGWSLNYEMFFYLLFAMGLAFPRKTAGIGAVVAVLAGLTVSGALAAPSGVLSGFYTNPIMIEFAAGMLIGLGQPRLPDHAGPWARTATAIVVAGSLLAVMALPLMFPQAVSAAVCGVPATVAVGGAVALERWGWSLRNGWVLLIGNASYAIYLTHPFVTRVVERFAARLPAHGAPGAALLLGVALAGIAVVGIGVHYALERLMGRVATRRSVRHATG